MTTRRLPVYFISHGAGPWPWLDDGVLPMNFVNLADSLRAIPDQVGVVPTAILMVSAHWEAPKFTVQTTPNPQMIYDYFGFPPHTYEIEYSAPGAPEQAARAVECLAAAGIDVHTDDARGFDHGVYSPLYVAYPKASVPVFQMSLREGLHPAEHLAVGRALAPLREEGVLIIGSGVPSYHNMRIRDVRTESIAFDEWLTETFVECSAEERRKRLIGWSEAPFARIAHPREEHLMPGLVAAGAAGSDAGFRDYHERDMMGWMASSGYRFGSVSL